MTDKQTKGAYMPFRELLTNQVNIYWQYRDELLEDDSLRIELGLTEYFDKKATSCRVSLTHYDELLRLHNLEEVK